MILLACIQDTQDGKVVLMVHMQNRGPMILLVCTQDTQDGKVVLMV